MRLAPGLTGQASVVVTDADTASAVGSGDVEALATPRVVALCEAATVAAVRGADDGGQTTVGTRIELDHLKPSYVGATVSARARLSAVDGRRLTFDVEVLEGDTVVARGIVVRALVDRVRFVRS